MKNIDLLVFVLTVISLHLYLRKEEKELGLYITKGMSANLAVMMVKVFIGVLTFSFCAGVCYLLFRFLEIF